MTLKPKLPLHIHQKYFIIKDSFDSFIRKIEVLSDSNVIINSIRILIVVLALLMGYVHTPKKKENVSSVEENELIDNTVKPIIEKVY